MYMPCGQRTMGWDPGLKCRALSSLGALQSCVYGVPSLSLTSLSTRAAVLGRTGRIWVDGEGLGTFQGGDAHIEEDGGRESALLELSERG